MRVLAPVMMSALLAAAAFDARDPSPVVEEHRAQPVQPVSPASAFVVYPDETLAWLDAHQCEDGSWDADGFMALGSAPGPLSDGAGRWDVDVITTSLSLLAFQSAGNSAHLGAYKQTVARGLWWLRTQMGQDGHIGNKAWSWAPKAQALGTLALCQAAALHGSSEWREVARRALIALARACGPDGGFYSGHGAREDVRVTGWSYLALAYARTNELFTPPDLLPRVRAWLRQWTDALRDDPAVRAWGALVRGMEDESRDQVSTATLEEMRRLACAHPELVDAETRLVAVLALDCGGEPIALDPVTRLWLYGTTDQGNARGSFDPAAPRDRVFGRVHASALGALVKMVFFLYPRARALAVPIERIR